MGCWADLGEAFPDRASFSSASTSRKTQQQQQTLDLTGKYALTKILNLSPLTDVADLIQIHIDICEICEIQEVALHRTHIMLCSSLQQRLAQRWHLFTILVS